jgi:hypothetical protein
MHSSHSLTQGVETIVHGSILIYITICIVWPHQNSRSLRQTLALGLEWYTGAAWFLHKICEYRSVNMTPTFALPCVLPAAFEIKFKSCLTQAFLIFLRRESQQKRPDWFCSKFGNLHEKIHLYLWRRENMGVALHFWAHKMHVKELSWVA